MASRRKYTQLFRANYAEDYIDPEWSEIEEDLTLKIFISIEYILFLVFVSQCI